VQPLEERTVPTVFTVTNTSDSGTGSLRAAITAADGDPAAPHTIDLTGVSGTITLASALPNITNDMTITGPGAGGLTVTGYASGNRVFAQGTPNLTVNGLTLTGRTTGSGAAVDQAAANENLTISNSVITGSSAGGGGVVYNIAGGTVTVSGTAVTNNTAHGMLWMSNSSVGGGTLNVVNSQLLNNTSTSGGGAISFYWGGNLHVDHSTIAGNSTSTIAGAVYVWGTPAGATTISNSTIANNSAVNTGGAIILGPGTNNLTVTSSTITGNVGFAAGAVYNAGTSTVTLDNSIVSGNTANGVPEISSSHPVTAAYSAIDTLAGMTAYTDNGGNLSQANSTPAALALQPLATMSGPNGTFAAIRFGAGSTAVDVGDPAQGGTGHTDELGYPRPLGAGVDLGAVEFTAPRVVSVQVGDGTAQRSEVRSITVTFDTAVTFSGGNSNAAAAFQLVHTTYMTFVYNTPVNNLQTAVTTNGSGQTVVTLTFTTTGNAASEVDPQSIQSTAGGPTTPSLGDGKFQLTVLASNVSGPGGQLAGNGTTPGTNFLTPAEAAGSTTGLHLWRLFGDATGNGVVDLNDLSVFISPGYHNYLDANNDGLINLNDLAAFRNRYNHTV
jgi:hypothetical protein